MSRTIAAYLSPEEQAQAMERLYLLLGDQVKSYQASGHMRASSSVPAELAQELLRSIGCTLDLVGGISQWKNLREGLAAGQSLLHKRLEAAKQQLLLVEATLPLWQEECRSEALLRLRSFLRSYDPLHLAHVEPELGCFPLVTPINDAPSGIDHALQMLRQLWYENQIMAAFPADALEKFQNVFCQFDRGLSENQCQQLLVNATGKILLSGRPDRLTFLHWEREALTAQLSDADPGPKPQLMHALEQLTEHLHLPDPNASRHVQRSLTAFLPRITAALRSGDLTAIFL